jgi:glycosyltransferase involved in cell wall biosynthesis
MAKPRICIDAFNLDMPKGSGIATYARNLGLALKALGSETHLLHGPARGPGGNALLNEAALLEPVSVKPPRPTPWEVLRRRFPPPPREAVRLAPTGEVQTRQAAARDFGAKVHWSFGRLFHVANRGYAAHGKFTEVHLGAESDPSPIDAMHWTCVLPLRAPKALNLYTIHDVVPLKLPFATLDDKPRFFEICAKICREADHVVTVSETSRQDIIRIFGVDEARITNTYQCVSLPQAAVDLPQAEVAAEIEAAFNLAWKGYFIFFGAVEPKKNLACIIEAYLSSGVATPLVIVGGRAWLDEDETRLMYDDLVQVQVIKDGVIRRADRNPDRADPGG